MSRFHPMLYIAKLCIVCSGVMAAASFSFAEETNGFFLGAASRENPNDLGFWSTLPHERVRQAPLTRSETAAQSRVDGVFDGLQLRAGYDFGTALGFLSLQQGEMGEKKTPELGIGLIVPMGSNLQISGQVSRTGLLDGDPLRSEGDNAFSVGATFRF